MSRTVRLSLALLFALMMVIATASGALALNPPDNAPEGQGANLLCDPPTFPAFGIGVGPGPGGNAPWNATALGGNNVGPLDAVNNPPDNECTNPA
jgi:hypothetical protein